MANNKVEETEYQGFESHGEQAKQPQEEDVNDIFGLDFLDGAFDLDNLAGFLED